MNGMNGSLVCSFMSDDHHNENRLYVPTGTHRLDNDFKEKK